MCRPIMNLVIEIVFAKFEICIIESRGLLWCAVAQQ